MISFREFIDKLKNSLEESSKQVRRQARWILILATVLLGFTVFHFQYNAQSLYSYSYVLGMNPWKQLKPATDLDDSVQSLIDAIREASEVVRRRSGLKEVIFSERERDMWKKNHTCVSRQELNSMYARLGRGLQNPQWDMVLSEYSTLHRTCTQAVGEIPKYFNAKNDTTGCKFFFTTARNGLGNKILHFASSFLYAVLTQRVLLIPASTSIPDILCEPFEGSSWRINVDLDGANGWKEAQEFFRDVDINKAGNATEAVYAARVDEYWEPLSRFFCHTEQEFYKNVTWLSAHGCLYFLPKLFAIPSFRPALEALFPDPSLTLTHLLRSMMLPSDKVWERARAVYAANLDKSDIQVGVQVRFFSWNPYEKTNGTVNTNILECCLRHGFLPNVSIGSSPATVAMLPANRSSKPRAIRVFIASLYPGLKDYLTNIYHNPTVSGDSVAVVQLTHLTMQGSGTEVDTQALVEILSLSFSNPLFVTGVSTFGGLAQAYGGIIPWFNSFENQDSTTPPCTLGQTVDICYQSGAMYYTCPHDVELHKKPISDFVTYFKACLGVDAQGQQLTHRFNATLFGD